ncbi:BLUF domain-containing protein [Parvibaculum sp. MBR-TMA-1.3b-4.2]|jgi:hypothetical protein
MIFQMACLSAWVSDRIDETELHRIFEGSAIRNNFAAITGALFCSENSFFHIVEGAEAELLALEARLVNDRRIRSVKRVALEKLPSRCFDEWSVVVQSPALISSEGCEMECLTCPQASICSVADFLATSSGKAAGLPQATQIMLDWFFRIQFKQNGLKDPKEIKGSGPAPAGLSAERLSDAAY